jgi:hypothetical protein
MKKQDVVRLVLKSARVQDVNCNIYPDKFNQDFLDFLKLHLTKTQFSKIHCVNLLYLTGNILPHDDTQYIDDELEKKAVLFCLVSDCLDYDDKKPDKTRDNYFYHDGVFESTTVTEKGVKTITFDCTKTHAMMVNSRFIGFAVWFKRKK